MDRSCDVVCVHTDRFARRVRFALCAAIIVGTVLVDGSTTLARPPTDTSGTAEGVERTARWWQVAITNFDTFFDDSLTGDNCVTVDLPSGPIVLVAGSLGGAAGSRACTVPANATLVMPVVNQLFAPPTQCRRIALVKHDWQTPCSSTTSRRRRQQSTANRRTQCDESARLGSSLTARCSGQQTRWWPPPTAIGSSHDWAAASTT